jgi:hypothetical protein
MAAPAAEQAGRAGIVDAVSAAEQGWGAGGADAGSTAEQSAEKDMSGAETIG